MRVFRLVYCPMTVLVTGAAGFIGFHVASKLLENGVRVVGLDNLNEYYDPVLKRKRNDLLRKNDKYIFYKVDISDNKKVEEIFRKERPNAVIHLAAQAGVRYSLVDPWAYAKSNYYGTLSIFEASRKNGVKRVLYASSSSVYGSNKKSPFSESHRVDTPLSLYAATKLANESLAHAYHHLFGTDMIGMRFFTVYGPWGRPDMAFFKFTKYILRGRTIPLYNKGEMYRSFTYVDDITAPIIKLLKSKHSAGHRIYNLGGAKSIQVGVLLRKFEALLGKKAEIKFEKMHIADVKETNADITLIKKDVGFTPRVNIDDGLKRFVDWYLENETWLSRLKDAKQ